MGLIEEPISVYLCVLIKGQEVYESKKSKVMGLWGVFFLKGFTSTPEKGK